ncbi:MAG: SIR2 family NAD-dependent protein deacylase [Limnochordia bacterium]|jgi:NAD-dependent deacetylase
MIVAFTGAGISRASGIPTFEERPELRDDLIIDKWYREPEKVWASMQKLQELIERSEPNPAHRALAEAGIPVVTQNIDSLHQRAGSEEVIEIHGHMREVVCTRCGYRAPFGKELMACPRDGRYLKPDIVFYGEDLQRWPDAVDLIERATTLLVIGTSLTVAPACYLPTMAANKGARLVHINRRAEEEVPRFLQGLA